MGKTTSQSSGQASSSASNEQHAVVGGSVLPGATTPTKERTVGKPIDIDPDVPTATAPDPGQTGPADGSLLDPSEIDAPPMILPKLVYPPEVQTQLDHLEELHTEHTRRLRVLDLQLARLSPTFAPPHLILDIEETTAKIAHIRGQIGKLRAPFLAIRGVGVLAPQQVHALRQTIADMLGIAIDDVEVLGAVLGSVVITLQLPLVAAAQLLALHRAGHPWAARAHIIDVQLLDAQDAAGMPATALVEQLSADEQARLRAADPAADTDTRLLLDALSLVTGAERRDALLARVDERLAEQRAANAALLGIWQPAIVPGIGPLDGSATLRVTFSDAMRQAA